MVGTKTQRVIGQIQGLFDRGALGHLGDDQLLELFGRDRDAEAAFQTLIARHGPSVLRTCRQILNDPGDVDDAFQATLLVLARRAGSLRLAGSVGPWLQGVARRVSKKARVAAIRRRFHEMQAAVDVLVEGDPRLEVSSTVHDEVDRLPERLRTAVELCYFEQMSYRSAAQHIGVTEATIRGRLATARELLRVRLSQNKELGRARSRRAPSPIALGCVSLSSSVMRLAEGALRMMFVARLIRVALVIAGLGAAGTAFVALQTNSSVAVGADSPQQTKLVQATSNAVADHDLVIQGRGVTIEPERDEIRAPGPGKLMLWVDPGFLTYIYDDSSQDANRSRATPAGDSNPPPSTRGSSSDSRKGISDGNPKLLRISWTGNMLFTCKTTDPDGRPSSRAEFHGRVNAELKDASLRCQERLIIWLDQVVPLERIHTDNDEVVIETLARPPRAKLSVLHGFRDVVVDSRSESAGKEALSVRQRTEADGLLVYDSRTGVFRIGGKGQVQLHGERLRSSASSGGQDPSLSRTMISFTQGMSGKLGASTETKAARPSPVQFWGDVKITGNSRERSSDYTAKTERMWINWSVPGFIDGLNLGGIK
jgi:RNA polymerase sigma factor (sigma-70 family)